MSDEEEVKKLQLKYYENRYKVQFLSVVLYIAVIVVTGWELGHMDNVKVSGKQLDAMYPGMGVLMWQHRLSNLILKVDTTKTTWIEEADAEWYKLCKTYDNTDESCNTKKYLLSEVTGKNKKLHFLEGEGIKGKDLPLGDYSIFAYYKTSKSYLDAIHKSYVALQPPGDCNIGEGSKIQQMACGDKEVNKTMISIPTSCASCWNLQTTKKLDLHMCARVFEERRLVVQFFLIAQFPVCIICLILWWFSYRLFGKEGWTLVSSYNELREAQTYGTMNRAENYPFLDFYQPAIYIHGAFVFGFSMRVWRFVTAPDEYYDCLDDAIFPGIYWAHGAGFSIAHAILGLAIGFCAPLYELSTAYWKITKTATQDSTKSNSTQTQQPANKTTNPPGDTIHEGGQNYLYGIRV